MTTTNKVKFIDPRPTTTVSLPSYEGAEIVVYQKLLTIDSEEIANRFPDAEKGGASGLQATVAMIAKCIKAHNFTDAEGNDLVFDETAIKQLPSDDLLELTCAVTGKSREELAAGVQGVGESEKKNQ